MTRIPSEMTPYKGPVPFETQDRELFFGRDAETDDVCAMIENNPVAVFYASSGTGKSSLLRARIIPALEGFRRPAAIFRPKGDPLRAMTASALVALLPPPSGEVKIVNRLIEFMGAGGESATLASVVEAYGNLKARDAEKRDLIAPVEISDLGDSLQEFLDVEGVDEAITPVLARCLFSARWDVALLRVLLMHEAGCSLVLRGHEFEGQRMTDHPRHRLRLALRTVPLHALRKAFADPAVGAQYERHACTLFEQHAPDPAGFLDLLAEIFCAGNEPPRVAIIADQFEQLFTLVAPEARRAFGEGLHALLNARQGRYSAHVLLSLRDDFLARLDQLEPYIGGISPSARYGLGLLGETAFDDAVVRPAKAFGYGYDDAAMALLKGDLISEEGYAEPGALQIVCEALWEKFGKELSSSNCSAEVKNSTKLPPITGEHIASEVVGGPKKILETHFEQILEEFTEQGQIEVLDMLSALRTFDQEKEVRVVVTKRTLVRRRLRSMEKRTEMLDELRNRWIVRYETHKKDDEDALVEIVHELILQRIGRAIAEKRHGEPRWMLIDLGLEKMNTGSSSPYNGTRLLTDSECEALCWFREHIDTAELGDCFAIRMIYEVLLLDKPIDEDAVNWGDHLDYWSEMANRAKSRNFKGIGDLTRLETQGGMLNGEELFTLLDGSTTISIDDLVKDENAIRLVVRSAVRMRSPEHANACLAKIAMSCANSSAGSSNGKV